MVTDVEGCEDAAAVEGCKDAAHNAFTLPYGACGSNEATARFYPHPRFGRQFSIGIKSLEKQLRFFYRLVPQH